jgi:hypothetical protein
MGPELWRSLVMRGSLGGIDLHAVAVLDVMLVVELPVDLVEEVHMGVLEVGVVGVVGELVFLQLVPLALHLDIWRRRLKLSAWQGGAVLVQIDIHGGEVVAAVVAVLVVGVAVELDMVLLTELDVLVGLVAELLVVLVVHLVVEELLV